MSLRSTDLPEQFTQTNGDTLRVPSTGPSEAASRCTSRVTIGEERVHKSELKEPMEGTLNPGYTPYPKHVFGNAAALGLAAFSITTFTLGLYLAGAMGITIPNGVVGLAMFYGGAVQFLAGIWELVSENCFAGTTFVSYGSFWLSFGAIYIESFGILRAYDGQPDQFGNAVGLYLIAWGIFTAMLMTITFKATWPFVFLFITLDMGFFLVAAAFMTGSSRCLTGGGALLTISALCGGYSCFSGISTRGNSYFVFKAMSMPIWKKPSKTKIIGL